MVPDNLLNTSSNTTPPLFPNTAQADLGISSDLSRLDALSKSIGSPSSLHAERTASQTINFQNNDSLISGDGSGTIFADTGKDIINASEGNNLVFAGKGNNRVITGSGNDFVTTGSGDDQIYTGLGDDNINAGDGNNTIEPGTGNDTVSLGNGSDRIVLEAGEGSVNIFGFNAIADKLRLGGSLVGKSISL